MKVFVLVVIAMCAAGAAALTDAEISDQFEAFKTKFGKKYADENEEKLRKEIFTKNLNAIEEHNKKYERGEVTYTQGVNHFTDLTEEERRPYTHGVLRPKQ